MRKKYYRFFGGLVVITGNMANKMADKGFRLIRTEKLLYEFEECKLCHVKTAWKPSGEKGGINQETLRFFRRYGIQAVRLKYKS